MGFTRLTAVGGLAAKGKWTTMMQAAIDARMRQPANSTLRAFVPACGQATAAKNRMALAKILADTQANKVSSSPGPKATPANTSTNKARLNAILAGD